MTGYAKTLSPTPIRAASPRPDFAKAASGEDRDTRPSTMVAKDKPHPAPRPSPGLTKDVDRAAFNRAWADEQHAARKIAFKEMRREEHTVTRSRTVTHVKEGRTK